MPESALEIESGQELERFDLGTMVINHKRYTVLTGYENTDHKCFWCGEELTGKLKRYCYGHGRKYYRHFEWSSARSWCIDRQEGCCANCGERGGRILEVHHIVPLKGELRYFTAFNLPWNLIGLCHECHQEVHAVMRKANKPIPPDIFEKALTRGQLVLEGIANHSSKNDGGNR